MKKKVDCKWIKYNAMKLEKGIYENLIDSKLAADIKVSEENGLICSKDAMDAAESSRMLAEYLAEAVRRKLDDSEKSLEDKKDLVNAILDTEIFAGDKSAIARPIFLRKSWTGGKRQSVKLSRGRRFGRARVSVSAIFSLEGNRLRNLDMRLSETLHPPTEYALLCRFLDCRE